ncbi:MAG: radical SAM protein [Spirochaetales bacterium]|nr:radical SAM protein [Spirochaetales bacterium]
MKRKLNIHDIAAVSVANGPGRRTVVWVQGCVFDCEGCFNQAARSHRQNRIMTVSEIMELIPYSEVEGITVSGGEPFYQAEGVYRLADRARKNGLGIMVYTGYTKAEILESEDPYFRRLLAATDILVDGRYDRLSPPTARWAGSGNQRIHFLTDRYKAYEASVYMPDRFEEIHISREGLVTTTGF